MNRYILLTLIIGVWLFGSELPKRSGDYATAVVWIPDTLQFAQNFELVEAGSFQDLAKLPKRFPKTLAYVWLAGFYLHETPYNPVARWALEYNASLTPHIHPMGNDFYYDLCSDPLRKKRVDYLAHKVKELSLYGLFFDWANDLFLYEPEFAPMKKRFKATHTYPYHSCIKRFLAELKAKGIFIVTNQAFRNPALLDFTDYDMSESYISTLKSIHHPAVIDGRRYKTTPATDYFPLGATIEATFAHLKRLDRLVQSHGVKKMIYMNYAAPKLVPTKSGFKATTPTDAIHYCFAFAKLFDAISYTEVPFNRSLEQEEIYFFDLGRPTGKIQRIEHGYMRRYERGFVVVSDHNLTLQLTRPTYDTFTKRWVEPGPYTIVQNYDTITKTAIPIGRVFLYGDTVSHQ